MKLFGVELSLFKPNVATEQSKSTDRIVPQLKNNYVYKTQMELDSFFIAIDQARHPTIPSRVNLITYYKQALRDSRLKSMLYGRIAKTTGTPFEVYSKSDKAINEELTDLITKPWFRKFMKFALESKHFGHSLIEFPEPIKTETGIEITDCMLVPREHVVPNLGQVNINAQDISSNIKYREKPFVDFVIECGDPDDLGTLECATKDVIDKNYARTDWSRHSEKFGSPFLKIGTAGMSQKEIDKAEAQAANFASNGFIMLDDVDQIQIAETKGSSQHEMYSEKIKMCNEEVSILLTGSTSISDQKSFAGSANVHERNYNEIIEDDMRWLTEIIEYKLFPMLTSFGYPLKDHGFRFVKPDANDGSANNNGADTKGESSGGSSGKKLQFVPANLA